MFLFELCKTMIVLFFVLVNLDTINTNRSLLEATFSYLDW